MASRFLLLACLALAACSEPEVHRFAGATMGSTYEVKFVGDTPLADVGRVVTEVLDEFDLTFSKWREDSEISRLNRSAGSAEPFKVSKRFADVLKVAIGLAAATEGAFDPTVEPMLRLYREAKAAGGDLDPVELAAAGARVGYRHVDIKSNVVHRAKPGVEFDLDGMVAGACIDEIAARLIALGVESFYIEVTGEIYCRGEKAEAMPWRIAVVDPRSDFTGGDPEFTTLQVKDQAVCTSGNYRNAFVSEGQVVHHVFDPRTGKNAESAVMSATVLGENAMIADAVGTALLVLGEKRAGRVLERLRRHGVTGALLLIADEAAGLRSVEFQWPEEK